MISKFMIKSLKHNYDFFTPMKVYKTNKKAYFYCTLKLNIVVGFSLSSFTNSAQSLGILFLYGCGGRFAKG